VMWLLSIFLKFKFNIRILLSIFINFKFNFKFSLSIFLESTDVGEDNDSRDRLSVLPSSSRRNSYMSYRRLCLHESACRAGGGGLVIRYSLTLTMANWQWPIKID